MFCSIMSVLGAIVEGSFFVLYLLFRQPGAAPAPIWVAHPDLGVIRGGDHAGLRTCVSSSCLGASGVKGVGVSTYA